MINAARKEFKNPPIEQAGTNKSAIIRVHAFTIKVSKPKDSRLKGRVIINKSGLMIILAKNRTNPIISRVLRSSNLMLLMIEEREYSVTTIDRYFNNKFFIDTPLYLKDMVTVACSVVTSTRSKGSSSLTP